MAWSTSNGLTTCGECGASAPVPRQPCSCPAATTTTLTTDDQVGDDPDELGEDLSAAALGRHMLRLAGAMRKLRWNFRKLEAANAHDISALRALAAAIDTERKCIETAGRIRAAVEQTAAIRRYGAIVEKFEARREGPQHEGAN